jgi:hypothetical protein
MAKLLFLAPAFQHPRQDGPPHAPFVFLPHP